MVTITLYKNCRLNNSYQEVFANGSISQSGKSLIDEYLDNLSKVSFTISNYYYENTGELIIDNNIVSWPTLYKPYDFNYMKVVDDSETNTLTRYCFINSISLKNGCYYISYEEDIWSSYSKNINSMLPSYLCRSRAKSYQNFTPSLKKLVKEYESNDSLVIDQVGGYNNYVYCLIELQLYDLVSGTNEKSIRDVDFYWGGHTSGVWKENNYIYEILRRFASQMPTGQINNHNFQIGKIYLISCNLISDNSFNVLLGSDTITFPLPAEGLSPGSQIYLNKINSTTGNLKDVGRIVQSGSITANYKNIAFGTMDKQLKINNNGTDIDYSIQMFITNSNLVIQLIACNEIIDITDSFLYEYPITPLLAEDFAQRKIATELESYKIAMKKGQSITSGTISNVLDMWDSIGNIIIGAYTGSLTKNKSGAASTFSEGRNLSRSAGNIIDRFSYEIPTLNKINESITAPKYSNSKGNILNVSNVTNYFKGLLLFKINPENSNFVKKITDNIGYEVYEFIDNYSYLQINEPSYWVSNNINYNAIKFETVQVIGQFTNDIAKKLDDILLNGVKIWFTYSLQEDNYTDDLL